MEASDAAELRLHLHAAVVSAVVVVPHAAGAEASAALRRRKVHLVVSAEVIVSIAQVAPLVIAKLQAFACLGVLLTLLTVLPPIEQRIFAGLVELLLDLQLELHHLLLRLQQECLLTHLDALPAHLARGCILQCHVEIDANFTRVFRLEAEPVDDIGHSLLIDELSANELFQLVNANRASKEEGVDF